MLKLKVTKIHDFSGGHITSSPLIADAKYTPDCLNVYASLFSTLKKRLGYAKLNSSSQSATGTSIAHYLKNETTQYLVSLWGAALKKMDVTASAWDGTWDAISANTNGTALTSGAIMHTVTFNNDLIITTESQDKPQKYDPSDNSGEHTDLAYGGSGTAPAGKFCEVWQDCVWIGNTSANPDRITRSALADHTDWSGATLDYYQDFVTPGDVGLTGIVRMSGRLYVFKRLSIYRVTWLGGTPTLDIKEVKSGIGTSSPRSIVRVEIPGEGERIIFLGTDLQLYKFDGYNCIPIGNTVKTYNGISTYCLEGDATTYGINYKYLTKVFAINDINNHKYQLHFPKDNDTTPSDSYTYDYYTSAFFPNHYAHVFNDGVTCDNGAGLKRSYVIGVNYAWLLNSGNSDDGTAINAYWDSMKIDGGSEVYLKKFGNLSMTISSVASTPTISYRADWDSSYTTPDGGTLTASVNRAVVEIPIFENYIQLRFADNSTDAAFELHRLTLSGEARGEGI